MHHGLLIFLRTSLETTRRCNRGFGRSSFLVGRPGLEEVFVWWRSSVWQKLEHRPESVKMLTTTRKSRLQKAGRGAGFLSRKIGSIRASIRENRLHKSQRPR